MGSPSRLYVGGGLAPGVGVIAEATTPVLGVFTRELAVQTDYVPRVTGGSGRLLTAVTVGGSVRLVRVLDIVQNRDAGPVDLDLGLRVGPSFYTAFFEPSAESRSRAFAVVLDPFARVTTRRASGRVFFAEVGAQAPSVRVGLATSFRLPR